MNSENHLFSTIYVVEIDDIFCFQVEVNLDSKRDYGDKNLRFYQNTCRAIVP